jgi:HK97 family phage major capsid protein
MPAVTQNLLEDSAIDLEDWIAEEVGAEFGRQEAIAFVSGDGANKPSGFLTSAVGGSNAAAHPGGALDTITTATAGVIAPDELVDFLYGLAAPYRQNATWLMNSTTAAVIAKMKDGQGNYLWREAFLQGQPATLLGFPVAIDENMPNIAANALAVAFGDWRRGYVINDRVGTQVLRDPFTAKPYVLLYSRRRVGGGVRDPRAIRLLKIKA